MADKRTCLIDWSDIDSPHYEDDFSVVVDTIIKEFNLKDVAVIKVEFHQAHCNGVDYNLVNIKDLYDCLDSLIQCSDNKNGIQLYKDNETGEKYLCITGKNYYDRDTDEYKGTNEVHVYFKEFVW